MYENVTSGPSQNRDLPFIRWLTKDSEIQGSGTVRLKRFPKDLFESKWHRNMPISLVSLNTRFDVETTLFTVADLAPNGSRLFNTWPLRILARNDAIFAFSGHFTL